MRHIVDAVGSHTSAPASTLKHLNNGICVSVARHVSIVSAARCGQVHFDTKFSSSESDSRDEGRVNEKGAPDLSHYLSRT